LVHSSGIIEINLAQWILFKGLLGGNLAVLNIYVPNEARARLRLWEELVSNLPPNCQWILCGDFNMVTDPRDNSNPKGHTVGDVESMAFMRFTSCV
jgi:endonuclease/exonuclease/phosphatase family metal-dependent hydrolase